MAGKKNKGREADEVRNDPEWQGIVAAVEEDELFILAPEQVWEATARKIFASLREEQTIAYTWKTHAKSLEIAIREINRAFRKEKPAQGQTPISACTTPRGRRPSTGLYLVRDPDGRRK